MISTDIELTSAINYSGSQVNFEINLDIPLEMVWVEISNLSAQSLILQISSDNDPVPNLALTANTLLMQERNNRITLAVAGVNTQDTDTDYDSFFAKSRLKISVLGGGAGSCMLFIGMKFRNDLADIESEVRLNENIRQVGEVGYHQDRQPVLGEDQDAGIAWRKVRNKMNVPNQIGLGGGR